MTTIGVVLASVGVGAGCQDPNRMFTGVWEAVAPLEDADWIEGRPELAIGHFGTELTGVVRLLDDNGLPTLDCRCAFIDHQRIELAPRRFIATSEACDGAVWIWDLTLDTEGEVPELEGTVTAANRPDMPLSYRARRVDTFIPDERRECER